MSNKIVSAEDALAIIPDGATLCTSGFVGIGTPDQLLEALERRFLSGQGPHGLTLVFAAGQGDGHQRGLNRLGHEGLLNKVIGGHWGLIPKIGQLALDEKIDAYNLPQGVISHLYREIAGHRPGLHTKVGLRTFVDPRYEGGRINQRTRDDMVRLVEIDGAEWLFYRSFPIHFALLRGTTADPLGNITMEREALPLDSLAMAMAAKNSGGFVIAQVERIAELGSLHPRQVKVPGIMVDCVVVASPEHHCQTYATPYSPAFAGEIRVPVAGAAPMALDERKVIARRAAFELPMGGVVNLGIGMPEGVSAIAAEERTLPYITLTTEPGVIGGMPASGLNFGAAVNTDAIIEQNQQFDFYDGGGLHMACLGMAECDEEGNVNVSRFGKKLAGCGGFINISQNARRLVFVGTFTAGGLEVAVEDGALRIVKEGHNRKFIAQVSQVTFNGGYAAELGQPVLYVTERCVFRRTAEGVELIEVAPGIDIERDILAHMGFRPLIGTPAPMDAVLFRPGPMGLIRKLLRLDIDSRISFDESRGTLFLDFSGLIVRRREDVDHIRAAVEARVKPLGRKVPAVVNYDHANIADDILDAYARMVRHLEETCYTQVSRYTSDAFELMKLGAPMLRSMPTRVCRDREEALLQLNGAPLSGSVGKDIA
jgi:propionate CoA-transferase